MNKQTPANHQNIFQNQYKTQKNGIAHGGVGLDKRGVSRARIRVDQPAAFSDTTRKRGSNNEIPRPKKHSTKRRKLQITTWVDEPLMLKLAAKARKRDLSMSTTVRRLLRKVVSEDDGEVDAALDAEMVSERMAQGNRALASRMAFLLIWIIYDVGAIKALASNTLGMQQGASSEMLTDIFKQANRSTEASLKRKRPELTPLVEAVEEWLLAEDPQEADGKTPHAPASGANGNRGKGGNSL
jgi:hypothetical protein